MEEGKESEGSKRKGFGKIQCMTLTFMRRSQKIQKMNIDMKEFKN